MGRLDGKVAIITGAASGIGRESAGLFAREGAQVIIADIDVEGGERAAAEIRDAGGEAVFHATDVAEESSVRAAVELATVRYGRLDVMFNNAGISVVKPTIEMSVEEWDRIQAVNLRGVFLGCKYAIPVMIRNGGGSVINVSSNAGLVGRPNYGAYCASKGGVVLLTKSLAVDHSRHNVRVNAIAPGSVLTPLAREIFLSKPDPEAAMQNLAEAAPAKRLGQPLDIAYAALYLASDDSAFVMGAVLAVDGGRTAGIAEPVAFHDQP